MYAAITECWSFVCPFPQFSDLAWLRIQNHFEMRLSVNILSLDSKRWFHRDCYRNANAGNSLEMYKNRAHIFFMTIYYSSHVLQTF